MMKFNMYVKRPMAWQTVNDIPNLKKGEKYMIKWIVGVVAAIAAVVGGGLFIKKRKK